MTHTDWIIDITLLLVVLRQVREAKLGVHVFLIPLAMLAWTASHYLHSFPTAGNDVALIATLGTIGAAFGLAGGLVTRMRMVDGHPHIRAGFWAATLWLTSMGARLAFTVYASHGGADAVGRFSAAHQITSAQAWVTAFVLMAIAEVAVRIGVIAVRGISARTRAVQAAAPQPLPVRVAA